MRCNCSFDEHQLTTNFSTKSLFTIPIKKHISLVIIVEKSFVLTMNISLFPICSVKIRRGREIAKRMVDRMHVDGIGKCTLWLGLPDQSFWRLRVLECHETVDSSLDERHVKTTLTVSDCERRERPLFETELGNTSDVKKCRYGDKKFSTLPVHPRNLSANAID